MRSASISAGIAACCVAGLVCPAVGQQIESADQDSQLSTAFDEEVIVRGRSEALLRNEIRLAEEALYQRFNEINSDDQFDIHCKLEPVTGSRLLRRLCRANFWVDADEDAAREAVRIAQGGFAGASPQQFSGERHYKTRLLADEMRRIAGEDEAFLQSLLRLVRLQDLIDETRPTRDATLQRATAAGTEPLPYDAELMVEVLMGREPWRHALTLRTFTIAQVSGEIRTVDLDCTERAQRLTYEPGVEWTLPESWGTCALSVDASRDTTFSLFEFD